MNDLFVPGVAPRQLDPAGTFDRLVDWIENLVRECNAPGFIIGLSGTDSIVAFLACARAFARLGRPDRVLGIHFGAPWPPPGKTAEQIDRMVSLSPQTAWMQRLVLPWLAAAAPGAGIEVDGSPWSDAHRWAALHDRSLNGARPTEAMKVEGSYWIVGTRNATERALFTYSNMSGGVSVQPLIGLWKHEILRICEHLGVPPIAIARSRQVDCDCGRFDLAANHIEEVDFILMARQGEVSEAWLTVNVEPELRMRLEGFVDAQIADSCFKSAVPYMPRDEDIVA